MRQNEKANEGTTVIFRKTPISDCGTGYSVVAGGMEKGHVQGWSYTAKGHGFAVWVAFLPNGEPLRLKADDWPVRLFGTRRDATEAILDVAEQRNGGE